MTEAEEASAVAESAEELFSFNQVAEAARLLAEEIAHDMPAERLRVLCVMNGGLITTGLLLPHLPNLLQLDYVHATRYRNQIHGDQLDWLARPHGNLRGEKILVVDDIFDEGHTLKSICDYCRAEGAETVHAAVLVNKRHDRKVKDFRPDYSALDVPDRYVFGCGMDYKGFLRNMPGIFALPETNR